MMVMAMVGAAVLTAFSSRAASAADPVVAAAGDIACAPGEATDTGNCRQQSTAALVAAQQPSMVLALGDNQYDSGTYTEYQGSFALSWGQFKSIIRPVSGNHEYATSGATGYFSYFSSLNNQSWYSFDLGSWHLVALDSNCTDTACQNNDLGSVPAAELAWLENDLAADPNVCTLAYWHHPRFASAFPGDSPGVGSLWDTLYRHHADLVLNGHAHVYERFDPQDPLGNAAADGIREIIAGTGGKNLGSFGPTTPNSGSRLSTFGAVFLTLHPGSYDWSFRREVDGTQLDSGTAACHRTPPPPPPPRPPPTAAADRVAPVLSALTMTRRRFAVSRAPTAVSAVARSRNGVGTAFRYSLSEPARVTFRIHRLLPGGRVGRRCLAPTRSRRRRPRCTRPLLRATLSRRAARGRRSTPFSGRIGTVPLAPGNYRATLTATDAGGNVSRPRSIAFVIVRR